MITDEDSHHSQEESSQEQVGAGSQESCEWDSFQDRSSYFDPLDCTLVEKDTRANSSTDNLLLDGLGHLQSVGSQGESSSREDLNPGNIIPSDLIEISEEEVFISEQSGNREAGIMPPRSKTPEQLHEEFELLFQSWKADAKKLLKRKTLPKYVADETEKMYQDLKVIFLDITNTDHEWEQKFENLSANVEEAYEIRCDLWHKFESIATSNTNQTNAEQVVTERAPKKPDLDHDIEKIKREMNMLKGEYSHIESEINELKHDYPNPDGNNIETMKDYLKVAYELRKKINSSYNLLIYEGAKYTDNTKQDSILKEAESFKEMYEDKLKGLKTLGNVYCDQYTPDVLIDNNVDSRPVNNSASNASTSSKVNLQRLPLPTFDGTKLNYLRFKKNFEDHVKYPTEKERLLALKESCLTCVFDKNKVRDLDSVKKCWDVLDSHYGDKDALEAEVYASWERLKTPKSDAEIVKFIDTVEDGMALLDSLGKEDEKTNNSSAALSIERKLPPKLRLEYAKSFTARSSDDTTVRMVNLLNFLKQEKKAYQMILSTYSSTDKKYNDDNPTISSQFSGVQRGRGKNGRGRGQNFRGGGNNVVNAGRGNQSSKGRGGFRGRGGGFNRGNKSRKCAVCNEDHATSKCSKWSDLDQSKFSLYHLATRDKRLCTWCLEENHRWSTCRQENEDLGCPCGSMISKFICCDTEACISRTNWQQVSSITSNSNSMPITSSSTIVNGVAMGEAMLPIQSIPLSDTDFNVCCMFDNCSQSTFISMRAAQKLNMKGRPISFILVLSDGTKKPMRGMLYKVELRDVHGQTHEFEAIGLARLSTDYPAIKATKVRETIHHLPQIAASSFSDEKISRVGGELDLLIGSDLANLHPKFVANINHLVILRSLFGTGWTFMGHNKDHITFTNKTNGYRVNCCAVEKLKFTNIFEPTTQCNLAGTRDLQFIDAISNDSVGVTIAPKCQTCKSTIDNCKECRMKNQSMTYLEFLEDQEIENQIKYLPEKNQYIASYPYTQEIFDLLPNKEIALKRTQNLEANLLKTPEDLELINKTLTDSFERGIFRFLTKEEIDSWDSQVHYLPINRVYKDSESTPCRLVFDSGQPDKNKRSLNSCMMKGTNPLNHFGSICMKFRSAEQVAFGDIKKMFHAVAVRPKDQHLRRFFARPDGFGGKEPLQEAVITTINFGEKAAGSVATAVKNRCADENKNEAPKVSASIKEESFMDDVMVKAKYDENIDDNIAHAENIMAKGNFRFKAWIKSGQNGGEKALGKSESGVHKNLGLSWKTEADKLVYRLKLNFNKKSRNRYTGKYTTIDTLEDDFPEFMTKRIALKLNHQIFDPCMLIQPWIMKLRLAFRDIIIHERETGNPGWDNKLPGKFGDQWFALTKEMFGLETLEFDRSIIPRNYDPKEKPKLVLFSDGSDKGMCVVGYLVWTLLNGSTHVSLITSRTKIASINKITTPRAELTAAQMQARLKNWLLLVWDIEVEEILHLVDASIVLGMIKNISLKFDAYTAPRVSEIQCSTTISSWYWIETSDNPSDLGTRGKVSIEDLGPNSLWRNGPDWLKLPFPQWPLRSDFKKHEIPGIKKEFEIFKTVSNLTQLVELSFELNQDSNCISATPGTGLENVSVGNTSLETINISSIVDFRRFSCFHKLVYVSARILLIQKLWLKKIQKNVNISIPSFVDVMNKAKLQWFLSMMPATREMLKKNKLHGLIKVEEDGIVYVTARTRQENWNPEKLVVLSPKHPLTRLILRNLHEIDHRGVSHTVARSRIFYWIPQASKLLKKIKSQCFKCRLMDAKAMNQLMSKLPAFRQKCSPVWHYSMIDLFGPISVRDFVNQRTSRKTWGVLITCLTTRVCFAYLAESYSTDHLLAVLRRHEARNGCPAEYFADLGTQIVGADRVMTEAVESLNKTAIEKFASSNETKFSFGTAHFPEGQGAVERLVKEIKKCLKVLINNNTLSFAELDTALAEASYLVNCRPLQLNPTAGDDSFICPNDLLMGRSTKQPAQGELVFDSNLTKRMHHVQRMVEQFAEKWVNSYYQLLAKYHKWKLKERNTKPGDVVLILDKERSKGKFALGIIDSVKVDKDDLVRKATVKYKLPQEGNNLQLKTQPYKYTERNVRGLALVMTAEERQLAETTPIDVGTVENEAKSDNEENDEDAVETNTNEEVGETDNIQMEPVASLSHYKATPNGDKKEDSNASSLQNVDGKTSKEQLLSTSSGRRRFKPTKLNL